MKKFVYEFKDHFEVAIKGEKVKAETIHLPAPSNLVLKHITVLDQEFSKSMMKISESKGESTESDKEHKISGQEVFMMMSAGGANLSACFEALKQICMKQGGINNEVLTTTAIFEKMSFQDTKELLGGYINLFLFSSLVD